MGLGLLITEISLPNFYPPHIDVVLAHSVSPPLLPVWMDVVSFSFFKKRFYLFIFRERGREGDREAEKYQCVAASHMAPTGDLAHDPGTCPDRESNRRPPGSLLMLNPLATPARADVVSLIP